MAGDKELSPAPLTNLHGILDDGLARTTRDEYLGQPRTPEVFDRDFPTIDSDPARDWPVPLHHPERARIPVIEEPADGPTRPTTSRDEPARDAHPSRGFGWDHADGHD